MSYTKHRSLFKHHTNTQAQKETQPMHTSTRLHHRIRGLLALLVTLALLALPALPARAAGFTVTTLADSGPGSLRQAIEEANATAGADTINVTIDTGTFGPAPHTIDVTSQLPAITSHVTINGNGATIRRSGTAQFRILAVLSGTEVVINDLTITNGSTTADNPGGGILNFGGTLTINNSTISGNVSGASGGGIFNADAIGGGSGSVLTVNNSIISGNQATLNGGGIQNNGVLTVNNSTISGNQTALNGGGIRSSNVTSVNLSNVTVTNNRANRNGGGLSSDGVNNVYVRNSIITGNFVGSTGSTASDCATESTSVVWESSNLVGDSGDKRGCTNASTTVTGGPSTVLLPLANYGGATQTHALRSGSQAIDVVAGGDCTFIGGGTVTTDQRGAPRPQGLACDIGAFEGEIIDQTPPQIISSVVGTLGSNDWYVSDVSVSWSVVDSESPVTNQNGCEPIVLSADTLSSGTTLTCSASSTGGANSQSVTIKRDTTAPTISFVDRSAPNTAGWNNSPVTLNWACSDATSHAASASVSQIVSGEGTNQSATGICTDNAGNSSSDTQTGINIDTTTPTLAPSISPNPIILGGSATATSGAADVLSGLASQSCAALDTTSVGTKTVICTATDNAGNSASKSVTYQVVYNWSGFFQPIDNLPTVNSVKAGSAVAVKFSLGGDQGLNIFASGYPKVQLVACGSGTATNEIEQTVTAGASGLQYDAAMEQYSYTWKTDKKWAGSCRQLILKLVDGREYIASFQFR